jgi:hypothetical protein
MNPVSITKPRLKIPSLSLLLTALTVSNFTASAHAASILVDGGFESAGGGNIYYSSPTHQSIDGGSWIVTAGEVYIDNLDPYVYAGNNSLNLTGANPYQTDSIMQALTTVAGEAYTVNFWANADSPNVFSLTENGVTLLESPISIVDNGFPSSATNGNSSLFVDYSATFRATSTTTDLMFTDISDPAIGSQTQTGSVLIDNVAVQPTPEPSSIALLFTGIVGLALLVGRKRLSFSVPIN